MVYVVFCVENRRYDVAFLADDALYQVLIGIFVVKDDYVVVTDFLRAEKKNVVAAEKGGSHRRTLYRPPHQIVVREEESAESKNDGNYDPYEGGDEFFSAVFIRGQREFFRRSGACFALIYVHNDTPRSDESKFVDGNVGSNHGNRTYFLPGRQRTEKFVFEIRTGKAYAVKRRSARYAFRGAVNRRGKTAANGQFELIIRFVAESVRL